MCEIFSNLAIKQQNEVIYFKLSGDLLAHYDDVSFMNKLPALYFYDEEIYILALDLFLYSVHVPRINFHVPTYAT